MKWITNMNRWLLLFLLALATPVLAVPPVPPTSLNVVQGFIRAVTSNDLATYDRLFASNAMIEVNNADSVSKAEWSRIVAPEFAQGSRQVRFLSVFETAAQEKGQFVERYLLVEEMRNCPPERIECFPIYMSETIDVSAGRIVRLERSTNYWWRLSPEGFRTDAGADHP